MFNLKNGNQTIIFYAGIILTSFIIGALGSLFGIGGGPLIVPVMIYFFGIDGRVARGTSLALVVISSLLGLISRSYIQKIDYELFFDIKTFMMMVIPMSLGSLFISFLIEYFTGVKIDIDPAFEILMRRALGILIMLIGVIMFLKPS